MVYSIFEYIQCLVDDNHVIKMKIKSSFRKQTFMIEKYLDNCAFLCYLGILKLFRYKFLVCGIHINFHDKYLMRKTKIEIPLNIYQYGEHQIFKGM